MLQRNSRICRLRRSADGSSRTGSQQQPGEGDPHNPVARRASFWPICQKICTAALKPLTLLFSIRPRLAHNRVGSLDFSTGPKRRGRPLPWFGVTRSSTAWESNTAGSVRRCFWPFPRFRSPSSRDGKRPRVEREISFAYWETRPYRLTSVRSLAAQAIGNSRRAVTRPRCAMVATWFVP